MTFLVDAQLPPRLADWLRDRGYAAHHVSEIGLLDADDRMIWHRALEFEAVLLTKDRDFAEWAIASDVSPQVVWIRFGNAGNASLIARLEVVWGQVLERLAGGARVVEAGRP